MSLGILVRLLEFSNDNAEFVSRSQAKRLLVGFDRFLRIILDFDGVSAIGQAFADEIFRVFISSHSDVEILPINCNKRVEKMILRAQAQ